MKVELQNKVLEDTIKSSAKRLGLDSGEYVNYLLLSAIEQRDYEDYNGDVCDKCEKEMREATKEPTEKELSQLQKNSKVLARLSKENKICASCHAPFKREDLTKEELLTLIEMGVRV